MSENEPLLTEIKDHVYWITINRPKKLNSITGEMLDLLSNALNEANTNKQVKCVAIIGAGDRAFSAGADIKDFLNMDSTKARKISEKGQSTFVKIQKMSKPVIAAINGYALGGGCELIQFCDIRLASEKARFSQPEVTLGLMPGWGGTYMLNKLVGETLATEMIMTGKQLNAQEALKAGLVSQIYPAEEFLSKVNDYIKALVNGPPISLSSIKKLVISDPMLEKALEAEAKEFSNLWYSSDLKEGINAFTERRKPTFKGK
jgi:enoyl-CoA hydratase